MAERFILNKRTQMAHDSNNLTERCNTDQIQKRERSDGVPQGFRLCRWCTPNQTVDLSQTPQAQPSRPTSVAESHAASLQYTEKVESEGSVRWDKPS